MTETAFAADQSNSQVSSTLWGLYAVTSPAQRSLAALRPFICPFGPILSSVPTGASVLDVGCGNGLVLALMSRFRGIARGVGVELSARALDAARKISSHASLPLSFVEASTLDKWPVESFDVVSMIDVLHHVPIAFREEFVSAALSRVAENGRFIYKDMASAPWWRVLWNATHDIVMARQLVRVEPVANVIRWASKAGFRALPTQAYVACGVYGHELTVFERETSESGQRDARAARAN